MDKLWRTLRAWAYRTFWPHIHRPDDRRGPRDVYLDGEALSRVFYADTAKGFVRMYHSPIRVNRRKEEIRWLKRKGRVEVKTVNGP